MRKYLLDPTRFGVTNLTGDSRGSVKIAMLAAIVVLMLVGATAAYAYVSSKNAFEGAAKARLSSIAATQAGAIEGYFESARNDVASLAQTMEVRRTLLDLTEARARLLDDLAAAGYTPTGADLARVHAEVREYYESVLVANLATRSGESPGPVEEHLHEGDDVNLLQYVYTVANEAPVGSKHEGTSLDEIRLSSRAPAALREAFVATRYALAHERDHAFFTEHRASYGYYDIFVVSRDGDVVYTNFKELDFNGNLRSGPQADTGLGEAFALAMEQTGGESHLNQVRITDFARYAPSYDAPAAFISAPIRAPGAGLHSAPEGALVFQLPIDRINMVTNLGGKHEAAGLGATGEAFLLGPDGFLRTDSRFLASMEDGRAATVYSDGSLGEGTNILALQAMPALVESAFGAAAKDAPVLGRSPGFGGQEVLTAAKELDIAGFQGRASVVVAMDANEILAPVRGLVVPFLVIGGLVAAFGIGLSAYLVKSMKRIRSAVVTLTSTSTQLATSIDEQTRVVELQSAATQQTTATMEQLRSSADQAASQAKSVTEAGNTALALAQDGAQTVASAMVAMKDLNASAADVAQRITQLSEQTAQITSVTGLVEDLANQTNMLALNAAVEASRAGEHGRGFAVVAAEIRKLADQSKRSTERIHALVADIQRSTSATVAVTDESARRVNEVVTLAKRTDDAFQTLAQAGRDVYDRAQQIALNAAQQAQAVTEVVGAMTSLATSTRQSSTSLAESREAVHHVKDAAAKLQGMV